MTTHSPTNHTDEPDLGLWGRALKGDSISLQTLGTRFWQPIYVWWRRAGLGPKKGVTATQACFERWLGKEPPLESHPGSLRMRDWVLGQLTDLASRGVKLLDTPSIDIDGEIAARRYDQEPALTVDDLFQRRWALTVFESVAAAMRAEYAAAGHTVRLTWLLPFLHVREVDEAQFSAVTARTGMSFGAVRVAVSEFRKRHRDLLRMAIADTVATQAEIDSELTVLLCNSAIGIEGEAAAIAQIAGPPTVVPTRNPNTTGTWNWQPPSLKAAARLFPNYEIIEMIGRGGMGVVYKAQQTALERFVAIKLLPLEVSANRAFAERFEREAKTLAKLNHPNIVAVHDFGKTSEGHLFFVMEFIHGTNLWQLIHGVGIEPGQGMEIIGSVCDALHYAHVKGVVHRDVKPANVLLDTEGRIKVADFGLARMNTPTDGPALSGPVMGTPEYMAPEHLRDVNVDHRADIYSLGVMLYEMLCREIPKGAFELPSRRTTVDVRVDAVVIKAMQQVPDRRYQTTADMKFAIDAIRTGAVTTTPTPRPSPASAPVPRVIIPPKKEEKSSFGAVLFVLLLAAAGIAGYFYFNPPKPPVNVAPVTPQPRARTDYDAVTFANSRYQLMQGAVPWSEAKARAEKFGGHLAIIESSQEDEFLRSTYSTVLGNAEVFVHIGAHRPAAGAGWQWTTGDEWKYTGWGTGEPSYADASPTEMPVYAVLARKSGKVTWAAKRASDETKSTFRSECLGFLVEWNSSRSTPVPAPAPEPAPSAPVASNTKPPAPEPMPPPDTTPVPAPPPPSTPLSEFTIWLKTRHAEAQAGYERDVVAPYKKAMDEVKTAYVALLDRQLAVVSKANNLDAAVALRNEKQRMANGGEIPAEDEALAPDSVKKLRAEMRPRIAKIERDRELRARSALVKYDEFLVKTQKTLTTNQKIDEAQMVKNLHDEVQNTWVKPAPSPGDTAHTPPGPSTSKTPAPPRAAKIPKRKLVEQLLARNALVSVREKGKSIVELKSASSLSDEEFQILIVHFRSAPEKPTWTDEDTALLDNLTEVPEIGLLGVAATDAVIERFRNLRDVASVRLANLTQLTPASASVIANLGSLRSLALSNIPWPAEALKGITQNRRLEILEFQNVALNDEAFAAFCAIPTLERLEIGGSLGNVTENGWQSLGAARKLKSIVISGGDITAKVATQIARASNLESIKIINRPVTDADILPLSTLNRLRVLGLDRTKVSGAGFGSWPVRLSLHALDLRGAGRVDDSSLKGICAAFPKIEQLELTANKGQLTPAGAANLGRLRSIKILRIQGDSVTDECAAEIAKADSLEELDAGTSVISEAGLAAMSKMDRLTRLILHSPVISDGVLRSLGKFRGLKEINVGPSTPEDNVRKMRSVLPGINIRN